MRFLHLVSEMMQFLTKNAHHFTGSFGAQQEERMLKLTHQNQGISAQKMPFLTTETPVGSEFSCALTLGGIVKEITVLGAKSWKTGHGNCQWFGAPKHGMWACFDNNFTSGVGKEHFNTVGRRLLKLSVLVLPSADVSGCFIDASDNKAAKSSFWSTNLMFTNNHHWKIAK